MINLEIEKTLTFSAQDRYDIISFAMDAADDNGFINSFVFERALYCYAFMMLRPERKDELAPIAAENILTCWNKLIEDNSIKEMIDDYEEEINLLAAEGQVWFEEYSDWAHSARGILDTVQMFSGDIVQNAANMLRNTAEETGVNEILDVANDWGMTRNALAPQVNEVIEETAKESLFN